MADQVEVTKLIQFGAFGAPADSIAVTKLVMFAVLVPGDSVVDDTAERQGFCYGQEVSRG